MICSPKGIYVLMFNRQNHGFLYIFPETNPMKQVTWPMPRCCMGNHTTCEKHTSHQLRQTAIPLAPITLQSALVLPKHLSSINVSHVYPNKLTIPFKWGILKNSNPKILWQISIFRNYHNCDNWSYPKSQKLIHKLYSGPTWSNPTGLVMLHNCRITGSAVFNSVQ